LSVLFAFSPTPFGKPRHDEGERWRWLIGRCLLAPPPRRLGLVDEIVDTADRVIRLLAQYYDHFKPSLRLLWVACDQPIDQPTSTSTICAAM
jgi:hypothetical protein